MMKSYDFREFTDKDLFECKLSEIIPDFGYINCKSRIHFLQFCLDKDLLTHTVARSKTENGVKIEMNGYDVNVTFAYSTMGRYNPVIRVLEQGSFVAFEDRKIS